MKQISYSRVFPDKVEYIYQGFNINSYRYDNISLYAIQYQGRTICTFDTLHMCKKAIDEKFITV